MLGFTVEMRRSPHSQVLRVYYTSPERKCPSLSYYFHVRQDIGLLFRGMHKLL